MATRGWHCTYLPPHSNDINALISTTSHRSILFVIDDADRQHIDLEALRHTIRKYSGEMRFRLIVAGRSTGAWWEPFRVTIGNQPLTRDRALAMELKALPDLESKERLFGDALSAFSSRLSVQWPDSFAVPDMTQDSVLVILASALLATWDLKTSGRPKFARLHDRAGTIILDQLLAGESRFRAQQASECGTDIDPGRLLRMMAVAGLLQATGDYAPSELIEHVAKLTGYDITEPRQAIDWLADFRSPDFLNRSTDSLPVSIIENLIIRALESDQKLAAAITATLDDEQACRLLRALERAHWHPRAERALFNVIQSSPTTMIAAAFSLGSQSHPLVGKVVTHVLRSWRDLPIELLLNLGSKIDRKSVTLLPAFAIVYERLIDAYANEPLVQSRWLNNYSACLVDLGQLAEAYRRSSEAVTICRNLDKASPDTHAPDLAASLNSLGGCLSALDRSSDALGAVAEAAVLYRQCAETSPDAYLPELAASLNSLGSRLAEMGRVHEALEAVREAVSIRRRLAEMSPDAYLPDLAASLSSLGACLGALDRSAEAASFVYEEASAAHRSLAAGHSDSILPKLASSFRSLTNQLMLGGYKDAAVSAMEECVSARRQLAQENHQAYLPTLAASLYDLARLHQRLGRTEDCVLAAREATDLYESLTTGQPQRFTKCLANSLETLGEGLISMGNLKEAREPVSKAVRLRRNLAAAEPSELSNLAKTLATLGELLESLDRLEEAQTAFRQVKALERQISATGVSN